MAIFTAIAVAFTAISSWTIGLGAFGSFAIGNFIIRAAVQLGVSALMKMFAGDGPQSEQFSIQGSIRTGGSVPRSFMIGPSLTAGSLVWHSEWGSAGKTPNAYYTQVVALSDLPIAGLRRWFLEGRAVTLAETESPFGFAAEEFTVNGVEHAWIKFHDGNQTGADPFLTGTVSDGAPRAYSASRIGTGIAYAIVTFRVNQELFTGFPRSKFVLDGVKLYDITKDTSQGGSGAHRWGDQATWGGDGDALPAVQAYTLARGLTFAGKWFYGLQGLTAARLPAAHWIAQIEKCRAPTEIDGGEFEPLYRSAGEITVNAEIGSAFEAVLTSCAGRMSEVGGIFKINVGAPDAPIAHFTDDDIVSLAPQTFTPFFGLSNKINGIIASYPSPDEGYVLRATPPLYNAAYEAEDGNRRLLTSVLLAFVPFPVQAQRLLQGELATARRARRHTHTMPAKFRKVEPGDVITWTSSRHGYVVKWFRVDGVIVLPNSDLIIDITEVDPTDHGGWNHGTDYEPVTPEILVPVRPTAQGVIGFGVSAVDIQDASGTARRPALLAQWNATVEDIAGIMIEVRLASSGVIIAQVETRNFDLGELLIEAGLIASSDYLVRAIYIPASPRQVSWTSDLAVTTNNVRLISADFASNIRPPEIVSALPGTGNWDGRLVVLTTDGKLYRYHLDAWTAAVEAVDISGQLTANQIAANAVTADKITANAIVAGHIATGAITAGMGVFSGPLQSSDFQTGAQGWQINVNGNAEFNNLIVRESIVNGAVSNGGVLTAHASPATKASGTNLGVLTLGAFSQGEFWQFAAHLKYRMYGKTDTSYNHDKGGQIKQYVKHYTTPKLLWRTKTDGVWASWVTLEAFPKASSSTWTEYSTVLSKQGIYEDVRIKIQIDVSTSNTISGSVSTIVYTNVHESSVIGKAVVR